MRALHGCLLLLGACDANVVDAVLKPLPVAEPEPVAGAAGGSSAGSESGSGGGAGAGGSVDPGAEPSPLETSLLHRYSFQGEGERVFDSKGAAHGTAVGVVLDGSGQLSLAGEFTRQHVALPEGSISGLSAATIEAWLTWQGGYAWQRIFDFGSHRLHSDEVEHSGVSYLFMTAMSPEDPTRSLPRALRVAYALNGAGDEEICHAPSPLPIGELTHVALVIDPKLGTMALYQDGQPLVTDCVLSRPLRLIHDVNCWLGRSNYSIDHDLKGSLEEFRIYDAALTAEQIAQSFSAGPDAKP